MNKIKPWHIQPPWWVDCIARNMSLSNDLCCRYRVGVYPQTILTYNPVSYRAYGMWDVFANIARRDGRLTHYGYSNRVLTTTDGLTVHFAYWEEHLCGMRADIILYPHSISESERLTLFSCCHG